jgi:putative endonuclease
MYFVYLLKHPSGRSYIGITTDIERRLKQHNRILEGGAKYTRSFSPEWTVIYVSKNMSKSDALKLEYRAKRFTGFEKRFDFLNSLCSFTSG